MFVNEGGAVKSVMGTGQIDTSGTQLLADNTGGGATTYDGISYTAGAITFDAVYNAYHAAANAVSSTGVYGTGGGANAFTLGAGGVGPDLVIGNSYRVQLLIVDGRGPQAGRTFEADGINQGVFANGVTNVTWGDSLLVTGTFVADATSQSFSVEAKEVSGGSAGGQLNAVLLHEVPEPGSLALLGLGGLLIARRRRG